MFNKEEKKERHKISSRNWARNHPEHYKNYREKNLVKLKDYDKKRYIKNHKKILDQNRIWRQKLKLEVLTYYSDNPPKCSCCDETIIEFLTIDHINNDGAEHRRKIGSERVSGPTFYRWLKRNNYPEGYQVLCYNCNCGKRANKGICPHLDSKGCHIDLGK